MELNMFSALIRTLFPQASQTTQRVSNGPIEIAPRDFELVAGGSPKGGWPVLAVTPDSPKGGWA